MPAQTIEAPHATAEHHKSSFFRQSGWMMITSIGGGIFMAAINIFSSKWIPNAEYSAFGTLLQLVNWMGIPAIGLQMVFAQQAPAAVTDEQKRQLVGTTRAVMMGTFCIWLLMALVVVLFHNQFITSLKLNNPLALWLTVLVGWMMLWYPVTQGLMQGRQNFLWLGWSYIFNGVGRFALGVMIVLVLHGYAAGLMSSVFIGLFLSVALGIYQNRDFLFHERSAPFDWRSWLKRVVPLTMGFGAGQFFLSADAIVVQNYLGEGGKAAPYIFGGTLARAIVLFTIPIAAVMFPKLVHSAARSQKTDLMGVTLVGTAILGAVAVPGLMITAPFVIQHFSNPANASILPDLQLFAWAMVPLAVGNVLLYNLMAHSRFQVSIPLVILAACYWLALQHFHDSFRMVIETLGVFTLLYLGLCALFTWALGKPKPAQTV